MKQEQKQKLLAILQTIQKDLNATVAAIESSQNIELIDPAQKLKDKSAWLVHQIQLIQGQKSGDRVKFNLPRNRGDEDEVETTVFQKLGHLDQNQSKLKAQADQLSCDFVKNQKAIQELFQDASTQLKDGLSDMKKQLMSELNSSLLKKFEGLEYSLKHKMMKKAPSRESNQSDYTESMISDFSFDPNLEEIQRNLNPKFVQVHVRVLKKQSLSLKGLADPKRKLSLALASPTGFLCCRFRKGYIVTEDCQKHLVKSQLNNEYSDCVYNHLTESYFILLSEKGIILQRRRVDLPKSEEDEIWTNLGVKQKKCCGRTNMILSPTGEELLVAYDKAAFIIQIHPNGKQGNIIKVPFDEYFNSFSFFGKKGNKILILNNRNLIYCYSFDLESKILHLEGKIIPPVKGDYDCWMKLICSCPDRKYVCLFRAGSSGYIFEIFQYEGKTFTYKSKDRQALIQTTKFKGEPRELISLGYVGDEWLFSCTINSKGYVLLRTMSYNPRTNALKFVFHLNKEIKSSPCTQMEGHGNDYYMVNTKGELLKVSYTNI